MSAFSRGKVKFFDETKLYGFITGENGKDVYFHYNFIANVIIGRHEPEIARLSNSGLDPSRRLRKPQMGDEILYIEESGPKGPRAAKWTYGVLWDSALREIANRPIYRVLSLLVANGQQENEVKPKVEWEGADLIELCKKFPRPKGRTSASADPLLVYYCHDDFYVRRWWEKKEPDGSWNRCEDPRPL